MRPKSYEELAKEWDEKIESGQEAEGLTRIDVKVTKNPRAVVAVRMSSSEFATITQAAERAGINFSEFLRQAGLAAANGDLKLDDAALQLVREQFQAFAATMNRYIGENPEIQPRRRRLAKSPG